MRRVTNIVGVLLMIVGLAATGAYVRRSGRPHPAPQLVRPWMPARILYPAGHYPALALPDGQKRTIRSVLNTRRPLRYGDYLWDESGIPAGQTWIRVDLARQTLSVFRAGHEIGSTIVLFGTDGKPTPSGVFPVLAKAEVHRSTLYDAQMPFMLRLTGDGVAIHASNVHAGAATHGCIGVPPAFARLLYRQIRLGDQVAILPA